MIIAVKLDEYFKYSLLFLPRTVTTNEIDLEPDLNYILLLDKLDILPL